MNHVRPLRPVHLALAFALWSAVMPGFLGLGAQAAATFIYAQTYGAGGAPDVITPIGLYSNPRMKTLAGLYRLNQEHLLQATRKFPDSNFRLLSTSESAVGGVGFWMNPAQFGNPDRYLGLFARVSVPADHPFRPDQQGRVQAIMDRYGKEAIAALAHELGQIPDPAVKGGALIFIFAPGPVNNPGFNGNAEAMVLFVGKQNLATFAEYRMTLQALFNQSDLFLFQGADQIQTLTQYFIQV